jgi:hypothetical protein
MSKWSSKNRGHSTIWKHPDLNSAIVDRNGYYLGPRVTFMGMAFKDLETAKCFVETLISKDNK